MGDTSLAIEGTTRIDGPSRAMRRLHFIADPEKAESWIAIARTLLAEGRSTLGLRLLDPNLHPIADALASTLGPAIVTLEGKAASPGSAETPDTILLLATKPDDIDAILLEYLDAEHVTLAAPVTARYWQALPLYLISIPKAGSHLMFRLAEALGYLAGGPAPDHPQGGTWYYLLNSNAHTSAAAFFHDALQVAPHGNRAHPFMRSPALFNYRNPLDILVSEASYFHIDGNSPLSSLLAPLSFEARIDRLLDDPWLLGTIRDRVGAFASWLECGNVIPVSFEEMIGNAGGGLDRVLESLIWSLQLKLHVPGSPEQIAGTMSVRAGPTFREGRIGSHRGKLTAKALERFNALPQDFMSLFGYDGGGGAMLPQRADEFRRRPLVLGKADASGVPFLVDTNYFGHNIVAFKKRFYGVPIAEGSLDLTEFISEELDRFPSANNRDTLRSRLAASDVIRRGLIDEIVDERLPAIVEKICPALPGSPTPAADPISPEVLLASLETPLLTKLLPILVARAMAAVREDLAFQPSADGSGSAAGDEAPRHTLGSELFEHLKRDIINAIYSPMAAEMHRELTRVMVPEIMAGIQPVIRAELDRQKIGTVHDLGVFLDYRLWRRADACIAVLLSIGAVDPTDADLASKRGTLASRSALRLKLKILWKWVRWAYWDGAKV
jgi:hypothetical protein